MPYPFESIDNVFFDAEHTALKHFFKQQKGRVSAVIIFLDNNTKQYCLPLLRSVFEPFNAIYFYEIKQGESLKNIHTCIKLWNWLSESQIDRKALFVNLGGGVICDMGAFAASVYKRGISFIHVPTTLLSMTDAAIGGKTGVNLGLFKNQIGLFNNPTGVFICPEFLNTLSESDIISGYAEMMKHALIEGGAHWYTFIETPLDALKSLIPLSVNLKSKIVTADPFELNQRKFLNLGHTIGHAVEMCSEKDGVFHLKHGEAVAVGLVCAAFLSTEITGLHQDDRDVICAFIKKTFKYYPITQERYNDVFNLMLHDKKNVSGEIKMVLLRSIGEIVYDIDVNRKQIVKSLDFYNTFYKQ